jgi:hypothetical protein
MTAPWPVATNALDLLIKSRICLERHTSDHGGLSHDKCSRWRMIDKAFGRSRVYRNTNMIHRILDRHPIWIDE